MLHTEFVKNLNCNYERIMLEGKPEENRYQYCIITRGGVKGILPCSLRYINGTAYLYYDISSTQSVEQLYIERNISRQWVKDFLWGMRRMYKELDRFLLDNHNVLWYPNQIFQDLEKKNFYFIYLPYYEGNNGFLELLDYLVEHIDYEDENLVECVYKMHEQFKLLGEAYLDEQIYEDGKVLESEPEKHTKQRENLIRPEREYEETIEPSGFVQQDGKKGIRYFFEEKLKKQKSERDHVYKRNESLIAATAVSEDSIYKHVDKGQIAKMSDLQFREEPELEDITEEETLVQEEIGKTVYMELNNMDQNKEKGLYTLEGKLITKLDRQTMVLGKKKGEVDYVIEDITVSRMHARITLQNNDYYLEDLNSTNGTSKNGLRLQPYEKRRLEPGDEIKIGKVVMLFK